MAISTTMTEEAQHWGLGRLEWQDISLIRFFADPSVNEMVAAGAAGMVVVGAVATIAALTVYRLWVPLFRDWIFSTDHKKIGIMYIVLALVMLARGVAEGVVMRTHQGFGLTGGFLAPDHFAELFSTHGTIMIFFVAMPLVTGFMNFLVPLQIGARDVAFPVLNQIGLGLTAAGAALIMISLVIGDFSTGGWTAYPPYTGITFQPGEGPDYWVWSVGISGLGSTLAGINIAVTIYKMRAPGMKLFYMPLFTWTAFCASIIMIFAMPPLTVATLQLGLDRYLDFRFFTNDFGGNMMNYANMFWLFGHPEVYLLVLPAYGIYSEVISTFSGKRIYGYDSLVYATMCIAVLSFTVWLHHFFTMGQDANVNAIFGIATMVIAVPTGVKVYDWMATMFRGRIRLTVPMIYAQGFLLLFVIGGLTGVILANPTIDYQVHNSVFLVAHFHNVLIPGVLFGMLAGIHFWFPKAFGFRLNEAWGRTSALLWIVGFMVTFLPLYPLGLLGMPRRSVDYADPGFDPYTLVAMIGAFILLTAFSTFVATIIISIRRRNSKRDLAGDPWAGFSLEWGTSSPPPEYNFPVTPNVTGRDAFLQAKQDGVAYRAPENYADIALPSKTPIGLVFCLASLGLGFAAVWHMWWLAILCAVAVPVVVILRSFRLDTETVVKADDIRSETERWLARANSARQATRLEETTPHNTGRAALDAEGFAR